jgi:hypothetical protein
MEVIPMCKLNKRFFIFGILFIELILFSGCQNIFIPQNVPIVIKEDIPLQSETPEEILIQSFNPISNGIVQDITHSGNSLILINTKDAGISYNIDLYDTDTQQLTMFISSNKRELTARYDTYDTGIYYVESMINSITEKPSSQLIWTDINKNTTRIISLPEENVMRFFGINKSDQVIYTNNNNEFIIADNQGNRKVYKTNESLNIMRINYITDSQTFVFIGSDPLNDDQTNLYYAKISNNSNELDPIIIEKNVFTFNLCTLSNQVIFIQDNGDKQIIETWDSEKKKATILSTGNFRSAQYTPNGEKIIFTQYSSNLDPKLESIWSMNTKGQEVTQISAPLSLTSSVIVHPFKSILYFSVEENIGNLISNKESIGSATYELTYRIE